MTINEDSLQSKLNKGHAALWDYDWEGAIDAYNEALLESPENPIGLSSLGLALFHQKNYRDSLRIFQKLASLYPDDPMPMERIARIYEREGLLLEAARSYSRAAELQLKSRDVDQSLSDYRAIIRISPENQEARARMAMIYDKLGRKKEAVAEFIDLAAILQQTGNPVKAMQVLEYALQVKPDSLETENAIAALKGSQTLPLRKTTQDVTAPVRMAQVREIETSQEDSFSQTSNDPLMETRLTALEEIAGLLFEDTENHRASGAANSKSDRVRTLAGNESPFGVKDRKQIQMHIGEFIDLQTAGKSDQAAVELERAIDSGLNHPAANYLLGLLLYETDPQKALKHLQRSVLHPSYALASYLLIGYIYSDTDQLKEATTNYLHALMLADKETITPEYAEELIQLYDPIFESQTLITQEKDLRNLCAVISGQLIRPDWRTYLKAAREQLPPQPEGAPPLPLAEMLMDSSSSQVVEALAEVRHLVQQGKNRSAMEEAYRALTIAPTYLPLHIQIGEILIYEGHISEAIEKFLLVARLYTIRGDSPQAIHLLTRVTRLAPMDITVRKTLIDLLRSAGRKDEVIQQYMDLANVHYLLADLDEARKAYHTALTLSRQMHTSRDESIKILNRLADIELQSLNWKEAIKIFEQLRTLLPKDPAPRIALIDLYFRLGLTPAAMNEVDAYLKLLENENDSQTVEKFLDDLLNERPDNVELHKRMAAYYISQDKLSTAIVKLDALAEKLLVDKNMEGSTAVVAQIIALNPPNREEYEKLYQELKKK